MNFGRTDRAVAFVSSKHSSSFLWFSLGFEVSGGEGGVLWWEIGGRGGVVVGGGGVDGEGGREIELWLVV